MTNAGRSNEGRGVLIFSDDAETLGELLSLGHELARRLGSLVTVVAAGPNERMLKEEGASRGADLVKLLHTSLDGQLISEESVPAALAEAVRVLAPSIVLIGASRFGAEAAARAAQILKVPCASNCVAVEADEAGNLTVDRRVFGGRFLSRQRLTANPRVVTIPPKRFPRAELHEQPGFAVQEIRVDVPEACTKVLEKRQRSHSQVDIGKAEIIVCAGRGVKNKSDLESLERLASSLGGVLAGSRPLTGDVDWLPVDRRVGLSGQTVKPNLYIACGISGQIEHVVGMKGARTVVAINNDPKAPIHDEADYSVVGDLYEIVPALLRACEAAKNGAS